jgi:hypothetical protein
VLTSFIHPEHELCLLAKKMIGTDWKRNLLHSMERLDILRFPSEQL